MDTVTTTIPSRSRTDRSTDGVVAGYIRELAGASAQPARTYTITAGRLAGGPSARKTAAAPATAGAAGVPARNRGRSGDGSLRRSGSRGRSVRGACPGHMKHALEAR